MSTIHIPDGNQAVMPYLMLQDAAQFIEFTKTVFGATQNAGVHLQPDSDKIMHAEIMIHGSTIMCCDAKVPWQPCPANMFVYVADADKTYREAISAGAASVMAPADQTYGRACGVTDPFGNTWWITSVPRRENAPA